MKVNFIDWLESVRMLMVRTKIIKSDVKLDEDSWRVYYDDNLTVFDTVVSEFGLDFKRRFIKNQNK